MHVYLNMIQFEEIKIASEVLA